MRIYVLILSVEHNFNTLMRMAGMIPSYDAIGFPSVVILENDSENYDHVLIRQILEFHKRRMEKRHFVSVIYPIKIENENGTEINKGNFAPLINNEIKNVYTGDELINIEALQKNIKSLLHLSKQLLPIKND